MVGKSEPDIFVQILNKVEKIDGIAADVREIKAVQREHGRILNEHTQILKRHGLRLDQLDAAVTEIHSDVLQHSRQIAELKSR